MQSVVKLNGIMLSVVAPLHVHEHMDDVVSPQAGPKTYLSYLLLFRYLFILTSCGLPIGPFWIKL
jgi:hypothetical protein